MKVIDERRLERMLNIGSFKWRYMLKRWFIVASFSALILFFSMALSQKEPTHSCPYIFNYIFVIVAFGSVSEINMFMVKWLSCIKRLKDYFLSQMLILLVVTVLLAIFWIHVAIWVFGDEHILTHQVMQLLFFFGVLLMIITHTMVVMSHMAKGWVESRKELENLKRAKLLSDYNSLQDRLNPHFLFNNLSVLRSLIRYSPDDAERFTENFTDVYRYLLRSHESQTVTVKNELDFLQAYIALHQERLGQGLVVNVEVDQGVLLREVPPMAIQLLVENAIKHNIASRLHPLVITVKNTDQSHIQVSNTINKKQTTYSTKTGLKSLRGQYRLIANKDIKIEEENNEYKVSIPLI